MIEWLMGQLRSGMAPRYKIYQASNWVFVDETGNEAGIILNGKLTHRRTINSKYGTSTIAWLHEHVDSCARRVEGKPKFKYLLPLDNEIDERIKVLAKTYPRICATSETSDTLGVHPGEGRAARTVALHQGTRRLIRYNLSSKRIHGAK